MNKFLLSAVAFSAFAVVFTSCGPLQIATVSSSRAATLRTAEVQVPVVTADLQIDQARKSGVASEKVGASLDVLKKTAIGDVLSKNSGDVLLEPSYVVENDGKTIKVTVTGYVAKYTNIKQGTSGSAVITVEHPGEAASAGQSAAPAAQPQKKGVLGLGIGGL